MNRLITDLAGCTLKNPVIAASGTFGFGEDYKGYYDPAILGGVSSKGLTRHPKRGNQGIRLWETPSGLLNSIGLENPGVEAFIQDTLPAMRKIHTILLANLGGDNLDEYLEGAILLGETDVDMIELNISCPNVKAGGMAFGMQCDSAALITREIKKVARQPVMVKLSPNAPSVADIAVACAENGADALSLVNTFQGMAIDIRTKRAVFENVYAGLSGPAIKPIALRMVHQVAKAVKIPVVGLGGISSWQDAVEFIMVGATAIQLGTGNFPQPMLGKEVVEGLQAYCQREGLENIGDIRGII
jgi:dihydroorotate dehydrogenase (NAD+) catalytic subunit